jgi:hypothetical protein
VPRYLVERSFTDGLHHGRHRGQDVSRRRRHQPRLRCHLRARDITWLRSYASDTKGVHFAPTRRLPQGKSEWPPGATTCRLTGLPGCRCSALTWLYHTFGFAVVSHASILSYLRGTQSAPRWMRYLSLPSDVLGQTSDLDGMDHKDAQFIYNGFGVLARPPLQGAHLAEPPATTGRSSPPSSTGPFIKSNMRSAPTRSTTVWWTLHSG